MEGGRRAAAAREKTGILEEWTKIRASYVEKRASSDVARASSLALGDALNKNQDAVDEWEDAQNKKQDSLDEWKDASRASRAS